MGLALLARALQIFGVIRLVLPARLVEMCALACIVYYPVDYLYLSRDFLLATVHLVIFLAVLKILSARTQRDHFYALSIAFLELLASAILSTGMSFFLVLAVFLCCLIAALTSGEIRRAATKPQLVAQTARIRIAPRLAALSISVTAGILTITAGLFFLLPRTASAWLRLAQHNYHLSGFSNVVRLGDVGELQLDSRTIMRVKPYEGVQLPPGLKWRGLTLSRFDGRTWTASFIREELPTNLGVARVATDEERLRNGPAVLYRVDLSPVDSDALFIAGLPEFLNIGVSPVTSGSNKPDGPRLYQTEGLSYRLSFVPSKAVRYEVSSALVPSLAPGGLDHPAVGTRAVFAAAAHRSPHSRAGAATDGRGRRLAARPLAGASPAPRLRLHSATAVRPGEGSAGGLSVHAQAGKLRILRVFHGRDAADPGHTIAGREWLCGQHLQSGFRPLHDSRIGRA